MTDQRKQIFSERVHIAMDNFFSSNEVLQYLGEGGWKGTMTYRRDHFPKSVPRKHLNFIKVAPVNARSKVARFEQPIIAITYFLGQRPPYGFLCSFFFFLTHSTPQHQTTPTNSSSSPPQPINGKYSMSRQPKGIGLPIEPTCSESSHACGDTLLGCSCFILFGGAVGA